MEKIYVVEGAHDEAILKQLNQNIKTISVGGSQIKKDVLDFLINHQDRFDIVLLLDPDHAGERIRNILSLKFKHVSHIFINRSEAISKNKKKVGIEHTRLKDLEEALKFEIKEQSSESELSMSLFKELHLTGNKESQTLRKQLSEHYHIGHVNAKTLLKRLQWLGVTTNELLEVLNAST